MKFISKLLATALALSHAIILAGQDTLSDCRESLTPVHKTPPALPPRLHNEFSGVAVVSYIVDIDGRVHSPTVDSTEWQPIGNSAGQPVGYEEAILEAIVEWRFVSRPEACRNQTIFEVKLKSDPQQEARKSNNGFNTDAGKAGAG